MTIRDLFDSANSYKILSNENLENLGANVESSGNMQQRLEEKDRFVPIVNFRYPENFARYGKAEKYYKDSLSRIYNDYPYDGSLKERAQFRNESSYLDLYLLDNKYPRSTGYSIFSPNGWGTQVDSASFGGDPTNIIAKPSTLEYIQVIGGPHESPSEFISSSLRSQFEHANKYDSSTHRESNLKCDFDEGVSIEFWMKKSTLMTGSTSFEVPAMLSNEDSGSVQILLSTRDAADPTQTRFTTVFTSGSIVGFDDTAPLTNTEILDDKWHHYAFTFQNSASVVEIKTYYDGALVQQAPASYPLGVPSTISEITGALKLNVGASRKALYNLAPGVNVDWPEDGWGKLSGSLDEFRYWKTARTSEEIGKYWFTQYGGGTNRDDANVDLGVYLKWNEGITGINSIDSTALDYSGRISNGSWTGYTPEARSTGSAMDEYLKKESEFRDPIIYSFHPRVVSLENSLIESGSAYDLENNASIYNSIPSWITEDDEIGSEDVLNLTQILASYFDTLQLQMEALPALKDKTYNDPNIIKPKTFSSRLLESQGFIAPEIFADVDALAQIMNRDDDRKYELDLTDIKNTIYQNVYNNLINIYKSKGTEKGFRNIVRCFGVDDELIRLNIYGNNVSYDLKDNYRTTTLKKRYADFNHTDRFSATVYQQTASGNPNTVSFISASSDSEYVPFTLEAEVIFPKKLGKDNPLYFDTPFLSSSLFGFHGGIDDINFAWPPLADDRNLQVYAVREELESKNVFFQLRNRDASINLTTDIFEDVYDNQKWNFALRYRFPVTGVDLVSGSDTATPIVELYGVNSDAGIVSNEFLLTASVASSFGTSPKRIYLGGHRLNFTGSIIDHADTKISSLRYWTSYLDNDVIKVHARDPSNYGTKSPYESTYLYITSLTGVAVPQAETLALNWDFSTVTSSDGGISGVPTISDAGYTVQDFSSGSLNLIDRYKWLGNIVKRQHTGRGDFLLPDDKKVVDVKYVYSGKQVAPEVIQSSDAISVLGESDIYFNRDTRPVNFFYALEKSMYQTISDEMLNIFSTIVDFNNLIGDPVNRYRQKYKSMEKLRQLFFERVQNTPDLDKYVEFYKWIDASLNIMLQQLVPMSADVSKEIRTMIESHILERNKYWTKFPTLEMVPTDPESGAKGINELLYDWKRGHHPVNNQQDTNCPWWKQRADRVGDTIASPVISSGDPKVDAGRQKILDVSVSALNRSYSTPYRLGTAQSKVLKGGSNVPGAKKQNFLRTTLNFGTTNGLLLLDGPKYVIDCVEDDVYQLNYRSFVKKIPFTDDYTTNNFNFLAPGTLVGFPDKGSVPTADYHQDSYGPDIEVPAQSPFTEAHVGGLQFRHAPANDGLDDANSRPEGWKVDFSPSGVILTHPDVDKPRAMYYRDETAKRPLNIRNIKGSYGNYTKDHQVVQSAGRYINNHAWVQAGGWDLNPAGAPSIYVAGLIDIPRIQRGRHESTIVSRFSAPGGPETMGDSNGGPGLDRYSAELSFNNDLNARNYTVRSIENKLLTSHVNQFGYFSNTGDIVDGPSSSVNPLDYSGTGSIYQVNRNIRRRLELSGTAVITGSLYDNYWVNHPIPQSDLQYAWINSSYESVDPSGLGYWHEAMFEFTTREKVVLSESFTSSLDPTKWTSQSVTMRQSDDSDNWIARMGTNLGVGSDPRLLTTAKDYNLPFRVDYSYARGGFQNPTSRMYLEFDGNSLLYGSAAAVSASDGRNSISFWLKFQGPIGSDRRIMCTGNSQDKRLYLDLVTPTNYSLRYIRRFTGTDKSFRVTLTDLYDSDYFLENFVHICLVDDENDPVFEPVLYVDGMNATTFSSPSFFSATGTPEIILPSERFHIGENFLGTSTEAFSGSMDSISWFNKLLTEAQAQELYNNGTPGAVQNVSFWPTSITASNQVHYWQLGDANNDEILLGAPPVSPSVYDVGEIPGAHDEDLYAWGAGDMQFLEYPGYNMASPQVTNDETMSFEVSLDSGATWVTASVLADLGDLAGNNVGFLTKNRTFLQNTPGQTARIRFRQDNFSNPKRDHWALNEVTISEITYVDPVTFSPYGDFVSRLWTGGPNIRFGANLEEIADTPLFEVYVPTVYNGLNYNVYEPIDTENSQIGYPLSTDIGDYLNEALVPGFRNKVGDVPAQRLGRSSMLNAILLKRNGPYQYPNWKQIRTGEHALARYYRNNNIITVTREPGRSLTLDGQAYIEPFGDTFSFKEPAVNSKYAPVEFSLGMRMETIPENGDPYYIVRPVTIKTSYGNNLGYFDSPKLNRLAKFDDENDGLEEQPYDVIKDMYLNGALNKLESPVYSLVSLKYAEKVYPAVKNLYSKQVRERIDFSNTFWRQSRVDRNTLGSEKFGGTNSQGFVRAQSAWALDGRTDFTRNANVARNYDSPTSTNGELQNEYTMVWRENHIVAPAFAEDLFPTVIYSRRQDPNTLYSVVSPNGMEFINTNSTSSTYVAQIEFQSDFSNYPGTASHGYINSAVGDAKWQSGELAGKIIDGSFASASTTPYYDDYDRFNEELRLKNKDYSIVPEFRISEHMDFYFDEHGGDFLTNNKNMLSIFGSPSASSGQEGFYKTYSHGDFMKFFEVIDSDHKEISDLEKTLTLKCSALKKFVPYDGFYPAERCLEIANKFSSSYSQYVTSSGNFEFKDTQIRMRPLMAPFMAPGILFNTIKSGIAVDYPVYTGSYIAARYILKNSTPGIHGGDTYLEEDFVSGSGGTFERGVDTAVWDFDTSNDGPDVRENVAQTNWIFRFRGTHSPDKRYLITQDEFETPFRVTFKYCRGDFENGLTPGYDLERPEVNDDFMFGYSVDGGTTWLTQSVFTSGSTKSGDDLVALGGSGFLEHTASFPAGSGSVKLMWKQIDWTGGNADNWAIDDVSIDAYFHPTPYYGLGPKSIDKVGWDYRVPFEAVLYPEMTNGLDFVDMEVNPQIALSSSLTFGVIIDPSMRTRLVAPSTDNLYKLMINNFLAETVEFFLKNGRLSSFRSNASDTGFEFKSGSYGMRVKIRRSMNKERKHPTDFTLPVDWYADEGLHETVTMYSKPSSYGPPMMGSNIIYDSGSYGTSRDRQQNSDSLFGRNPSFTPPYYDGESWIDIVYSSAVDRVLTLEEFFMSASVNTQRIPNNEAAWPNIPGAIGAVVADEFPMHRKNADDYAMQLNSSINLFGKAFDRSVTSDIESSARWTIEPKMEVPVLNFGDKTRRPLTFENIALPTGGDPLDNSDRLDGFLGKTATPIGMWHQFGLIPEKDEGIHLSIEDIPVDFLNKPTLNSFYVGGPNMKSLIDIVGFNKGASRKIGKVAESKTVHEAVVAIPYIIKDGERKFFKVCGNLIKNARSVLGDGTEAVSEERPGDSIIDMVSKMKRYILPPRMDFVANDSVDPFAIYIFEFSHTFDQNDLSYIWQNTMPTTGTSFEEATAELSHKIINKELLETFKDKIKWLVFKAKQRGNNNYFSLVSGQSEEGSEQHKYSYNWPYDYFSMVEFIKIESEIEYSTEQAIDINDSFAEVNESLQKGVRSTKQLIPSQEKDRAYTSELTMTEAKTEKREKVKEDREKRKIRGAFKAKDD